VEDVGLVVGKVVARVVVVGLRVSCSSGSGVAVRSGPDEGAVGVLSGGASRHNGGCSGEPAVHRDKSNSKPDSRGTKEKGALAKGGGGKESYKHRQEHGCKSDGRVVSRRSFIGVDRSVVGCSAIGHT
jgi:hypothetical protein